MSGTSDTSETVKTGIIAKLIRFLMRQGWRRGIVEGNPAWTVVGGLGLLALMAGRAWHKEAEVVFSEKLAPGQIIRITNEAFPRP